MSAFSVDEGNPLRAIDANKAPAVTLSTREGRAIEFAPPAGQVTLVHFWATWCAPCVEEFPALQDLQQDHATQPLHILTIAADSHKAVARFSEQHGFSLPILIDQYGGAMRRYQVNALPTSYLIDKQGRLRYRAYGKVAWQAADVRQMIAGLLAEQE